MTVVSDVLLVLGAVIILLSGVGVLRFHHTFERMHAASKGPSLGIILVGVGAALHLDARSAAAVLLVVVLHLVTIPVGSHLVGKSAYRSREQGGETPEWDEPDAD
jgi:multicomponent Na+:H+ antiporter subunit G